jgi:hypothetical protein
MPQQVYSRTMADYYEGWWDFCPQKRHFTEAPDFSGLDPDTGEPWSPRKVVEILGLEVQDSSELQGVCEGVIQDHPKEVELYRKGKTKVLGKLIKATLDASGGKADPRAAKEVLETMLR